MNKKQLFRNKYLRMNDIIYFFSYLCSIIEMDFNPSLKKNQVN